MKMKTRGKPRRIGDVRIGMERMIYFLELASSQAPSLLPVRKPLKELRNSRKRRRPKNGIN